MRGDPLHLCCKGHPLIMFVGAVCPFCAVLKENQELRAAIAEARKAAREGLNELGQAAR